MVVQDPERVLAACRSQPAVAAEGLEDRNAGLVEPNEAPERAGGELRGGRLQQVEREQGDGHNDNPTHQQPAAAASDGAVPGPPASFSVGGPDGEVGIRSWRRSRTAPG